MYSRKGSQGTFWYYDNGEIEDFRYNAIRKNNRIKANNAFKENRILDFPTHLIVESSSKCNLLCDFCNREKMARPQVNMPLEMFRKIAKEGLDYGIHSISLYALGEPLLNNDLAEMIEYVKLRDLPYIDVSTNGMFPLLPLLHTGLDDIIVSLDGLKERHEKLRKGAKYDEVIKNANEFINARNSFNKKKPTVRLQIIDFPESRDDIKSIIENPPFPADIIYVKNIEVFTQTLGFKNLDKKLIEDRFQKRTPCPQIWFILTINADGDICYCCHDPKQESVIGNIKDMTIKQAWDHLRIIRQEHFEGKYTNICSRCVDWCW